MALGIDKTLEVFEDLGVLAVSGISVAKKFKDGVSFGKIISSMSELMAIGKSAQELLKDAPDALPELGDLDAGESARIGAAAYSLVRKVLDAVYK